MSSLEFQQLLYIVIAPVSAVFIVILVHRVIPNLNDERNKAFVALVLIDLGWLLSNWLEALWPTREGAIVLMTTAYVFISTLPVAWLEYSLRLAGKGQGSPKLRLAAVLVIPAMTIAIAYSNEAHHLLWTAFRFSSVLGRPFLETDLGSWFWVHASYSYGLIVVGSVIVMDAYRGLAPALRSQARLMMVAVLLPIAYNVIYVTGMLPDIHKDYTSVIFTISAALFAVASDRFGLFTVVPIARSALFESLNTAVFVLNERGMVLDANAKARELLHGKDPVGTSARMWKQLEQVTKALDRDSPWETDVFLDSKEGKHPYELTCTPLRNRSGKSIGQIVSLHDVAVRYELVKETSSIISAVMKTPHHPSERPLAVCSACGKAVTEDGSWKPLEQVLTERYGIRITHGLCPHCADHYKHEGEHSDE
ncbi:MAG: PAS domain-containing protein [Spirochaetales bacterium]|nr:PAS domain-containing protein [Spirochaetales bacterium]